MSYNGPLNSTNVTAGYVDLATNWKIEAQYLYSATALSNQYNNPCGITYFERQTKRCSWFTQIPVQLRCCSGQPGFGQEFSISISRMGEYLLNTWLQIETPDITLLAGNTFGASGRLRYTKNPLHNLIEDCTITCNEQTVARLDNTILDVLNVFIYDDTKRAQYDSMIGNIASMTSPHAPTQTIAGTELFLPLPFFYGIDSGIALPVAGLLFNDIKLNFKLRNWSDLLILDHSGAAGAGTVARSVPIVGTDIAITPVLKSISVWATYILLNDIERNRMAENARDIIIETWQQSAKVPFSPLINGTPVYEPKFAFGISQLYFLVENTTFPNDRSNYTTSSYYDDGTNLIVPIATAPPIKSITLNYENTTRLSQMSWGYFSKVVPWFTCANGVTEIGYGVYSYGLNQPSYKKGAYNGLDAQGSTNFSKLGNTQIQPLPTSAALIAAAGTGGATSGADFPQTFRFMVVARSSTVIRIADGQLTFPFV